MTKTMLMLIALCFAVPEAAMAQGTATRNAQGLQSLQGSNAPVRIPDPQLRTERGLQSIITVPRSLCDLGSQSVRICDSDFQSCNSVCFTTTSTIAADGCTQRCCNNFRTCL